MSKLKVKKVIIFKHGISYYTLEGKVKGPNTFELEFKIDEMNDVLKSLFVLDNSERGYISSISYDAALETSQLLKSIMLNIPDIDSFSSLITQIKVKVRPDKQNLMELYRQMGFNESYCLLDEYIGIWESHL